MGFDGGKSSFTDLLRQAGQMPTWDAGSIGHADAPEATTVLALKTADGVVMVGDRRATMGNLIAHRRMDKVFPADLYSAVAIAGTAGIAMELVKLFQTELEHYEKLEGNRLSLEGKANYLAALVRNQMPLSLQGLVVVPLFCGFDEGDRRGRIYTYDVVGGRYEEVDYAATGSGSIHAKAHLRAEFREGMSRDEATRAGIEAIVAAAEEDTATGGPDLQRDIYPIVAVVDTDGYQELDDDAVSQMSREIVEASS
jgi:proteasome beta subunit